MSGTVWYISFSNKKIEFKKYPKNKKTSKKNNKKTSKLRNFLFSLLFLFSFIFLMGNVSAAPINDTFHINLQTTYSNGTIQAGTFNFAFNITDSSSATCSPNILYNYSAQLTTDSRGIVSIYLPQIGTGGGNLSALNYDTQYYLCYYRDGVLQAVDQLGRVPYSFRATQVNLSEVNVNTNLTLGSYNISANSINISGLYYGNGSQLTGITATTLGGYPASFFMPLNNSVYGGFNFNGGFTNGGLSINGGNIFAQTGYFVNITALNVTNLNINGSIIPYFDNQFDLGNSNLRYRDLWVARNASIAGNLSVNQNIVINSAGELVFGGFNSSYVGIKQATIGGGPGLLVQYADGSNPGNFQTGNLYVGNLGSSAIRYRGDSGQGFQLGSGTQLTWTSGTSPDTTGSDTGITRQSAGIVEVTNAGSTLGTLLTGQINATTDVFSYNNLNLTIPYYLTTNNTFAQLTTLNNGTYANWAQLANGSVAWYQFTNNNFNGTGYFNTSGQVNGSTVYASGLNLTIPYLLATNNTFALLSVLNNGTYANTASTDSFAGNFTNFSAIYAMGTNNTFAQLTTLNNGTYANWAQLANGTMVNFTILNNGTYSNVLAQTLATNNTFAQLTTLNNGTYANWAQLANGSVAWYQFTNNNFNGTGYFNTSGQVNGSTVYASGLNLTIPYLLATNNTFAQLSQLNNGTYIVQSALNNGTYVIASVLNNGSYFNTASNITGVGTANYIPMWTSASNLNNSGIYQNGGNVGIGTASPDYPLTVKASGKTNSFIADFNNGNNQGLFVGNAGTGGGLSMPANTTFIGADFVNPLGSYGPFAIQTSELPRIFIDTSGNVGIGTTTPTQLLNVFGDANITGTIYTNFNQNLTIPYLLTTNNTFALNSILNNGTYIIASVLNNGSYFNTASGSITGAGTLNYIPMWNGTTSLSNSAIYQLGSNVGIGTANPLTNLDIGSLTITNQATNHGLLLIRDGGTNGPEALNGIEFQQTSTAYGTKLYEDNTNDLFGIATRYNSASWSSNIVIQKSTGNVGIGTTSPNAKLTVSADGQFGDDLSVGKNVDAAKNIYLDSNSNSRIALQHSGTREWSIVNLGTDSDKLYFIDASNNNVMVIQQGGNVGIGTTTPSEKLEINGNVLNNGGSFMRINGTGTGAGYYQVMNTGGNTLFGTNGASAGLLTGSENYAGILRTFGATSLNFGTNDAVRMVINGSTGNVGIGTTSPATKLSILGTGTTAITINGDNSNINLWSNSTNAAQRNWTISQSNLDYGDFGLYQGNALGNDPIGGGTARLYIKNNGNVGIGTTTPQNVLNVLGDANVTGTLYAGTFSGAGTSLTGTASSLTAGTASALASTSQCSAGQGATGISTSGAAQGCTTYLQSYTETDPKWTANYSGTTTIPGTWTFSNTVTASKFTNTGGVYDPAYNIDNTTYATYAPSINGVKEEVSDTIELNGTNNTYVIDFSKLQKSSDLWLFYQLTDFGTNWTNLQVMLSPGFDGNTWYTKDPVKNTLTIHGSSPGEVSYRLTATRMDYQNWPNLMNQTKDIPLTNLTSKK